MIPGSGRYLAWKIAWTESGGLDYSPCMLSLFSHVQLFATLWTVAREAPLSTASTIQTQLPCSVHPPSRRRQPLPKYFLPWTPSARHVQCSEGLQESGEDVRRGQDRCGAPCHVGLTACPTPSTHSSGPKPPEEQRCSQTLCHFICTPAGASLHPRARKQPPQSATSADTSPAHLPSPGVGVGGHL